MTGQLSLLDSGPGAVRVRDPQTSHAAAKRQRGGVPPRILAAFTEWGAMCDDELCDVLEDFNPATVKTARSRMSKPGGPLVATGEVRLSHCGAQMQVYDLASRCRRVETVRDPRARVA